MELDIGIALNAEQLSGLRIQLKTIPSNTSIWFHTHLALMLGTANMAHSSGEKSTHL